MSYPASFLDKLQAAVQSNRSLLCAGLDPDPFRYPQHFSGGADVDSLTRWGQRLIDLTADLVCCYKPNFAFYEQFGPAGLQALQQTIAVVPRDIPVLLDAKRGDIGSTAAAYARAAFETWGADAVTVSPYLGRDSVAPFLAYPGKAVFLLVYTSNPSAASIQEFGSEGTPLFHHVLRQGMAWGSPAELGFVVGATRPDALRQVRALLAGRPHWILAPGVGVQGGNLAAVVTAGLDSAGQGVLVPVSRSLIYDDDPRAVAQTLRAQINEARQAGQGPEPPSSQASRYDDLILALHDAGCVQFGEFTLASGQQSPIYLDLRRLASSPSLLRRAAAAYSDLIRPLDYQHLAAVPYAALSMGTAVALAENKPLIYPRKETKAHGTGRSVEGVFAVGDRAVVIEDLVTSGGSVLQAISTLEAAGLVVSDVVVLIDREQQGAANLAAAGYQLHAALTLSQILDTLRARQRIGESQHKAVLAYLRQA